MSDIEITAADVLTLLHEVGAASMAHVQVLMEQHQAQFNSAGDGYTEPREAWYDCSCGVTIWGWQQYYAENPDKPEDAMKLHLIYMLIIDAIEGAEKQNECPYNFSHTKSWCGYDGCRES